MHSPPARSSNVNATPLSLRTTSPPTTQIIYQLPNETLLENLAIGQILVTVLSAPELWQVTLDPKSSQQALERILASHLVLQ
ncbi:hypothetical protein PILCRDRAFT_811028 [Piloderma croceum F 1598]|uniref:Uncharacterized protein n=1 Tax=Piloderma croceum (strain F 1598) TaxID=765440 RepID=A0A0C3GJB8_PILCF|nr:hypothetical protein PILCRDRAFT_811028 [Piloderma croceum F 1598]